MEDKILYGLTALFRTPDDIIKAAKEVTNQGFKKFDVNTPYPVHGMSRAMKIKPSTLGYFALAVGLSGAAFAILFMSWATGVDYPNVIGGKPFFALPAFVPIMFEVTVLSASIATVLSMLIIFFKLPNNAHPLHDTDYMKSVSNDKFGIVIEAKDKNFDEQRITELFQRLNAEKIIPVYYDLDDIKSKNTLLEPKFIGFQIVVIILIATVTYFTLNKLMYMPPFTWMMEQDRINAQQPSELFADGIGMRPPVQGTVAKGWMPYKFSGKPEEAEKMLVNPLQPTKEVLAKGKENFDIYCSPCHGYLAKGDGRLNGLFPVPPSLHTDKVRNWGDGRIYHIITEGQNIMPGYAKQIPRETRWAIVEYVRQLQRSLNAKQEDVK